MKYNENKVKNLLGLETQAFVTFYVTFYVTFSCLLRDIKLHYSFSNLSYYILHFSINLIIITVSILATIKLFKRYKENQLNKYSLTANVCFCMIVHVVLGFWIVRPKLL